MTYRDILLALFVMLIWGFNFVAVKIQVSDVSPLLLSSIRFFVTALILIPLYRLNIHDIKRVIPIALVLGVGHFGFLFVSMQGADSSTIALLLQLGVPFTSLLALYFYKDKIGPIRSFAITIAFLGGMLLAGEPQNASLSSILAIIFSAFCWALANVMIKKLNDIAPLALMGWMSLLAFPIITIMSLSFETDHLQILSQSQIQTWVLFAYTVIGSSIVSYHVWYSLLGRCKINDVVPYTLLAPVIGVAASVWILGDALTIYKIIGGLLTLIGITIIQLRQLKKSHAR